MSWFNRSPKPAKHHHDLRLVYAHEIACFNKHTNAFDLAGGIEWVRRCSCGKSESGREYLGWAAFLAKHGPVEAIQ